MSDDLSITVNIPTGKLTKRGEQALKAIKPKMKQRIIRDCNQNVPLGHGTLRNSAHRWAPLLDDYIKWDTPYAHFQHTGKVMIGIHSHSPWAAYGERKIYTSRSLTYRHGGAKWVDKTFSQKRDSWVKLGRSLFKKEFNK